MSPLRACHDLLRDFRVLVVLVLSGLLLGVLAAPTAVAADPSAPATPEAPSTPATASPRVSTPPPPAADASGAASPSATTGVRPAPAGPTTSAAKSTDAPSASASPSPSAAPARPESPRALAVSDAVDVRINVVGPTSANGGAAFTYTVTVSNNALPDADGATFSNSAPAGATGVEASCSASRDASCGTLTVDGTRTSGTVERLPHLGVVTITVTGRFPVGSSSVSDSAHVDPPAGTTDSDPASNDSSVSTALRNDADVSVTETQVRDSAGPENPNTYTVSYRNAGPAAADGTSVYAYTSSSGTYTRYTTHLVSCAVTAGASCPAFQELDHSSANYFVSTVVEHFPAASSITLTFTVEPFLGPKRFCNDPTPQLFVKADAILPAGVADPDDEDQHASVETAVPAPDPCPQADVSVTTTQTHENVGPGNPNTYTVTYSNAGPSAADGTNVYAGISTPDRFTPDVYTSFTTHLVSCEVTDGATCPAFREVDRADVRYVVDSQIERFPAGSSVTLVYTVEPLEGTCGHQDILLNNGASAVVPSDMIDPDLRNQSFGTSSAVPATPRCPEADVSATITQTHETAGPGDPDTYTVTYRNAGPAAADGASASAFASTSGTYTLFTAHLVSCVVTDGATCPAFREVNRGAAGELIDGPVEHFPAGSSITLTYTVEPFVGSASSCREATPRLYSSASVNLPVTVVDPVIDQKPSTTTILLPCVDVAVNKSVTPASARAGEPVSYAVAVSNSAPFAARSVAFSDPLPIGFVYASSTCTSSDSSVCGPVTYDPASRVVASTIDTVGGSQGSVTIAIQGSAGAVPGTYKNTATAGSGTGSDEFFDPNPESNSSTVSLQVFNTLSRITVTKALTGLPESGLSKALNFTGSVSCGTQGAKPWSLTIPAGESVSAAASVPFFDGESCSVTEDPPAAAPSGYRYLGEPVISPATIEKLGPERAEPVLSTSALALTGQLRIDKTADRGTAAAGDPVGYTVDVTNTGPVDAVGVTATDDLPEGLDVSAASDEGVVADGQVTWTGIDLPAGVTRSFTVQAVVRTGTPLGTLVNRVRATNPDGFDPVEVRHACADEPGASCARVRVVGPPTASIAVDKRLVSQTALDGDRHATVVYALTVSNTGDAAGGYDLRDTFGFGAGITVDKVIATSTSPDGADLDPTFDGQTHTVLVTGAPIGAGATHTYRVAVDTSVSSTTSVAQADCTLQDGETGTGYLNTATLSAVGGTSEDGACGRADLTTPDSPTSTTTTGGGPNHDDLASTGGVFLSWLLVGLALTCGGGRLLVGTRRRVSAARP